MEVQLDPASAAAMGVRPEDTGITLPDGFERFTAAQRRAWAAQQIEGIALEMLADIAAMHGKVPPTPEQRAAYLASVKPGIDEALGARR